MFLEGKLFKRMLNVEKDELCYGFRNYMKVKGFNNSFSNNLYDEISRTDPFIASNFPSLYTKIINVQYQRVKNYPIVLIQFI